MNESVSCTRHDSFVNNLVFLKESLNWISIVHCHAPSHSFRSVAADGLRYCKPQNWNLKPNHYISRDFFYIGLCYIFNPSVFCKSLWIVWVICVTACVPNLLVTTEIRSVSYCWRSRKFCDVSSLSSSLRFRIKLASPSQRVASAHSLCPVCVSSPIQSIQMCSLN